MQNPNLIIFSLSLTALFLLFSSSHELKIRLKSLTPDHLSHGYLPLSLSIYIYMSLYVSVCLCEF